MKVVTVVGARPQFIKAAPVCRALAAAGIEERLVHTGQHYDEGMSSVFFREMGLPEPAVNLGVGSGPHGQQTGRILERVEEVLVLERPDLALVYGDTNSTLAGALAAVKLHIPLAHVEAGLRSFNREMPEEHNRVLTDHCADFLFCPTATAVANLRREGVTEGVHLVGDTMCDAVLEFAQVARASSGALERLGLAPASYSLATVHRPANADAPERLEAILGAFAALGEPVVFAVHPRTARQIEQLPAARRALGCASVRLIEPVGYLDMLMLLQHARRLFTDSGGLQKEAYLLGVPCVTLRLETEWTETVDAGWNTLVGADPARILAAAAIPRPAPDAGRSLFGDGRAAPRIADVLSAAFAGPAPAGA